MTAAEVEHRRTAMLRPYGIVLIVMGRGVSEMTVEEEEGGILHDLDGARDQGEDEHQGADLGGRSVIRLEYRTCRDSGSIAE